MKTIIDRIAEIADKEGVAIGRIEKKIGASQNLLAHAIAKKTDIQSKWLPLILENYPKYSAYWLLTGKGDMFVGKKDNAQENVTEINKILVETIAAQQKTIQLQTEILASERKKKVAEEDATSVAVKKIG